jgi:CheY-like chemotaxis protein
MALQTNRQLEVVLIDDDDDDYYLLKQAFKAYSNQLVLRHLSTSTELSELLSSVSALPDLILLDFHMPLLTGLELVATLKQNLNLYRIPIVIWSGSLDASQVVQCYQAGASSVILKSGDQSSLERSVSALCIYWFETVQLPTCM